MTPSGTCAAAGSNPSFCGRNHALQGPERLPEAHIPEGEGILPLYGRAGLVIYLWSTLDQRGMRLTRFHKLLCTLLWCQVCGDKAREVFVETVDSCQVENGTGSFAYVPHPSCLAHAVRSTCSTWQAEATCRSLTKVAAKRAQQDGRRSQGTSQICQSARHEVTINQRMGNNGVPGWSLYSGGGGQKSSLVCTMPSHADSGSWLMATTDGVMHS